ncbi:MAG: 50S ribosomal protein L18 [Patescibacteria group bacterium]
MSNLNQKLLLRNKRHARVRSEISGTAQRPRVAVFKSNKSMYVQIIDDVTHKTLVGMGNAKMKAVLTPKGRGSDQSVGVVDGVKGLPEQAGHKEKTAYALGQTLADKMKGLGIKEAVFDRGGFKYHGRVKAVAEGLRQNGIKI